MKSQLPCAVAIISVALARDNKFPNVRGPSIKKVLQYMIASELINNIITQLTTIVLVS